MTIKAPVQILTVILGDESYGVDILRVQEIRGWTPVTRIPHTPPHVLGVLNLRGSIVPVVDLRMLFGLEKVEYSPVTVIVVLSVVSAGVRRNFGLVVDGVSDVVDVDGAQVRPAPDIGAATVADHILGLLPIAERMVILLDIDKLIGREQLGSDDAADPSPVASAA
jgi:purine-binding chemotaxis protein CheW